MKTDNPVTARTNRVWYTEAACDIDDFARTIAQTAELSDYPHARAIEKNVVIYDAAAVIEATGTPDGRKAILAEICDIFARGPGVAVFKAAYTDPPLSTSRRASSILSSLMRSRARSVAATISPSPAPTTASGTRWRSIASPIPRISRTTTPIRSSRSPPRPGSARITR
jgi:hypothetical protein